MIAGVLRKEDFRDNKMSVSSNRRQQHSRVLTAEQGGGGERFDREQGAAVTAAQPVYTTTQHNHTPAYEAKAAESICGVSSSVLVRAGRTFGPSRSGSARGLPGGRLCLAVHTTDGPAGSGLTLPVCAS
jgi:hypothetical protein